MYAEAVQNMTATVEEGGLLVHTPGAIRVGARSRLSQRHDVWLEAGASAVVVDMCDTRRAQQEGWPHHTFSCGTESRYFRSGVDSGADTWDIRSAQNGPFFTSMTDVAADPAAYMQAGCATA